MTTTPLRRGDQTPQPVAEDAFVLPAHLTDGKATRGPRFADMVWDLRPFLRRTARQFRLDFSTLPDEIAVRTAKEYLYSRLRRAIPGRGHSGGRAVPLKLSGMIAEVQSFRAVCAALRAAGAPRLRDVTHAHLEQARATWQSSETAAIYIAFLRHLADHSPFLTADRLTVYPWPGRTANAVAGRERSDENRTARIPEAISAPLLAGAVFYVQTASKDILAALREVDALQAARDELDLKPGEAKRRLQAFIARRRREGRGIPALPAAKLANRPGATVVDGVVQHANYHTVGLLTGVTEGTCRRHHRLLDDAGRDLGFEVGGLDTPRSPWPAPGAPWRSRLDPVSLSLEVTHLRAAAWIVIAFLSGMRDEEVRELGRDCTFTEPADDGRARCKLRGRVYKGARLSGEEADWVVAGQIPRPPQRLVQHPRRPVCPQRRRRTRPGRTRDRPGGRPGPHPSSGWRARGPVGVQHPPVPEKPGLAYCASAVRDRRRRQAVQARPPRHVLRLRGHLGLRVRRRGRDRGGGRPAGLRRGPLPRLERRRPLPRRRERPHRRRVRPHPTRARRPARRGLQPHAAAEDAGATWPRRFTPAS